MKLREFSVGFTQSGTVNWKERSRERRCHREKRIRLPLDMNMIAFERANGLTIGLMKVPLYLQTRCCRSHGAWIFLNKKALQRANFISCYFFSLQLVLPFPFFVHASQEELFSGPPSTRNNSFSTSMPWSKRPHSFLYMNKLVKVNVFDSSI